MPWKETDAMEQKEKFIGEMLKNKKPFKHLCQEFGISEKTGHKWKKRFLEEGKAGLLEESRAPISTPNSLPEKVVIDLLSLKYAHESWGPKKILALYEKAHKGQPLPSLSSVKRIFDRAKLTKKRKVRKVVCDPSRLRNRILPEDNNDVWAIDFKGWWKSDGEICEPFTVRDLHSRFLLEIRLMESKSSKAVRKVMTELFKKYGLPKVIRSDNGTQFSSPNGVLSLTNLSAWWITLGIMPDRTEKGKPGQNGSLERMHSDIAREIQGKVSGGRRTTQAVLDAWREEYNNVRPNEAIGMKTPSEVYQCSLRKYSGDMDDLEYPPGFQLRHVYKNGTISFGGVRVSIGFSLRGLTLGLKPLEDGKYHVFLADFLLGTLDADLYCFIPWESVK
ncbi:MAG: integrase core domain-containing protein [Oscillospiraceae bacterium]|jgi:transposase InsO family protein|nr:integrase core domain-containing protein [Oscillospiraceae bacterium]